MRTDFKPRVIYRVECVSGGNVSGYITNAANSHLGMGISISNGTCYQFMAISWANVNFVYREPDMEVVKRLQRYIGELKGYAEDEQ
jgi:hypothetical protein